MPVTKGREQAHNQRQLRKATENLAELLGAIGVGGKLGLQDVGVEAVNRVKRALSIPGTGRIYRRPGRIHQASAPGQPPAVDLGQYRASWSWRAGRDVDGDYVEFGTNDRRGPWFEFGTRRMRPRPVARIVVNQMRAHIAVLIRDRIVERQTEVVRRLPKEIR